MYIQTCKHNKLLYAILIILRSFFCKEINYIFEAFILIRPVFEQTICIYSVLSSCTETRGQPCMLSLRAKPVPAYALHAPS